MNPGHAVSTDSPDHKWELAYVVISLRQHGIYHVYDCNGCPAQRRVKLEEGGK